MHSSRLLTLFFVAASFLAVSCGQKMMHGMKHKKSRKGKGMKMMCMMKYNELQEHVNSLQTQVNKLSNPVHVHVHGVTDDNDNIIMSEHQSHEHSHDESMEHEHEHTHGENGKKHSHTHRHGHHEEKMTDSEEKDSDDIKKGKKSKEDKESEEEEDDDSSNESRSSSEEKDEDKSRRAKGTHVHIHLNMGAEVAALLAKDHKKGDHKHDHGEEDESKEISMEYPQEYAYARCDMIPNSAITTDHNVRGSVFLRQKPGEPLQVNVDLYGFDVRDIRDDHEDPRHFHGFHVHQYGDFSDGCNSFGGHFNPGGHSHGGPNDQHRHVGDWGNIECDHRGVAKMTFNETSSTLFGAHSVVGRGLVLHERADDLGMGHSEASKSSGDAGGRIACCLISWYKGMW